VHESDLPPRPRRSARIAAVGTALLLAALAPRLYAQLRVGVVDLQRALVETDQGRRAKNQLRTLFQKRQEDLDGRQQGLKRMRDEIEGQRNSLVREALQRRMDEYQRRFVELQQNYMEYQQELAQREAELTKSIFGNLQGVIRQLGQAENMTVILEQNGVVWSPQNLDLTERVVQMYNVQFPNREGSGSTRGDAGTGSAATPVSTPARDGGAPVRALPNPHPRGEGGPPPSGGGGGGGRGGGGSGGSGLPPPGM